MSHTASYPGVTGDKATGTLNQPLTYLCEEVIIRGVNTFTPPCISMMWGLLKHKEHYRVIPNSLTHFTKSVHLNNAKDLNVGPTHRKRNSPRIFYVERVLSFFDCRQGSKLSKNGGDGCREGFLRVSLLTNTVDCGCAVKF